jgi:TRAP-type C4-dicarboxylate transport system permease small subunit
MRNENPAWFVKADHVVLRVYKAVSYLAALSLIGIMLIAFINVCGEKLGRAGLPVSGLNSYVDWIAYLHVVLVFLSCGYVTIERGHTCVDILTNRFGAAVQKGTAYLGAVLGMGISGLMTYRGFAFLLTDMIKHKKTISTSSFSFPAWPFGLAYCVGLALLTFSFVWMILRLIFRYTPPPVKTVDEAVPEGGEAQ